jgi:hypothetical protein
MLLLNLSIRRGFDRRCKHHGIKNLLRFKAIFSIPYLRAKEIAKDIAGITVVEYGEEPRGGLRWRLRVLNDRAHLG